MGLLAFLRVATVFFAILLDLFMNGHLAHDGVVFLQLHALGGVLPVLGGNVS